jgi:hypothetical protein
MAESIFTGIGTYAIAVPDTAFGTAGTPTGADYIDKVTAFNWAINDNMSRNQGIGEGRNATSATLGVCDVTGSVDWELTDPDFLKYCFIGTRAGSGTTADPYELTEVDCFGYTATTVPTLTIETGSKGCDGTNHDVMTFDGCVFNTTTISGNVGEKILVTGDWTGRYGQSSTAIETYTAPTNRPFTWVDGEVKTNSDVIAELQGFSLTVANNNLFNRTMGSRYITMPVAGVRRYDMSFTIRFSYNNGSNILSGQEFRGLFFNGTTTGTAPTDGAEKTAVPLTFTLSEGATTGDRNCIFQFEDFYVNDMSVPITVDGGKIEVTFNGFALAGLTNKPITWWTAT